MERFLRNARADLPVYISDVRDLFLKEGTRPFHLHVVQYDDTVRCFPIMLPAVQTKEEKEFAASFVHAMIYNILSSLGAVTIRVYLDPSDEDSVRMGKSLDEVFQSGCSKAERSGYGKCMNVNERVLTVLTKGEKSFRFEIHDVKDEPETGKEKPVSFSDPPFASLPAAAADKKILGIDIGGTDIKFACSVCGKLAVFKEYDWFPAGFATADEFLAPVMQLVEMMRCAAALYDAGREDLIDLKAFSKDASSQDMEEGIRKMQSVLPEKDWKFDAIGLSFPDVVIDNLIVGGETHKTKGMRDNRDRDYEKEFGKISVLASLLKTFVREGGAVMNTNDGPMAAFTAAVELAAAGEDVSKGFFAHTLGTELGTGWVRPDGSIPGIPLEVYNFIIDLGSFAQKGFPPHDVRSINNLNTFLPGTLQKYTCQNGVFRLAAKYLPMEDPDLWKEILEIGLFALKDGDLIVPVEPKDMRKPALEFFMKKAAGGHPVCCRIFREIGTFLAVTWQETEYILHPEAKDRSLFGRLVKMPECFELMQLGAQERVPGIRQYAADSSLAYTDLMKQLDAHPDYTVAQFAQAVGAVFFGCMGLK